MEQMEERVGVDPTPSTSVSSPPPPQKKKQTIRGLSERPAAAIQNLQHQFAKTGNHQLLTTDVALTLHHSHHTWLVIPSIKIAHHVCDFFAPHIDSLARTGGGGSSFMDMESVKFVWVFFVCMCVSESRSGKKVTESLLLPSLQLSIVRFLLNSLLTDRISCQSARSILSTCASVDLPVSRPRLIDS